MPPGVRQEAQELVGTSYITAGQAWTALGADPEYTPSRPDKKANGTALFMLNKLGRLRLVGEEEASGAYTQPSESGAHDAP